MKRKIQIKTTARHHSTPTKMAIIKYMEKPEFIGTGWKQKDTVGYKMACQCFKN